MNHFVNVIYIGINVFNNCRSLDKIFVSSINNNVLNCCNLKNSIPIDIKFNDETTNGNSQVNINVSIHPSVYSIKEKAFYSWISLTQVSIPDSVTLIGEYAFYECSNLKEIIIPSNLKRIGKSSFSQCCYLERVIIQKNSVLTSIYENAFANCTSLKELYFPKSVTYIRSSAFQYCSSLQEIKFEDKSLIISIGGYAFYNCKSLENVSINNAFQLKSIGNCAFYTTSLAKVSLPSTVKKIETNSFSSNVIIDFEIASKK